MVLVRGKMLPFVIDNQRTRAALAPEAQPLQDLIDRILFGMAGLTEAEAAGLESRLANML